MGVVLAVRARGRENTVLVADVFRTAVVRVVVVARAVAVAGKSEGSVMDDDEVSSVVGWTTLFMHGFDTADLGVGDGRG